MKSLCHCAEGERGYRREQKEGMEKDREIVLALVCRTRFLLCGAGTHKKNAKKRKKEGKKSKPKYLGKNRRKPLTTGIVCDIIFKPSRETEKKLDKEPRKW